VRSDNSLYEGCLSIFNISNERAIIATKLPRIVDFSSFSILKGPEVSFSDSDQLYTSH